MHARRGLSSICSSKQMNVFHASISRQNGRRNTDEEWNVSRSFGESPQDGRRNIPRSNDAMYAFQFPSDGPTNLAVGNGSGRSFRAAPARQAWRFLVMRGICYTAAMLGVSEDHNAVCVSVAVREKDEDNGCKRNECHLL